MDKSFDHVCNLLLGRPESHEWKIPVTVNRELVESHILDALPNIFFNFPLPENIAIGDVHAHAEKNGMTKNFEMWVLKYLQSRGITSTTIPIKPTGSVLEKDLDEYYKK